ncbi:MAG: hypothetical protein KAJ19_28830 [Gammaproteobacteria bacterium]|nr:hypothetical protein [Gammaproteobacteria bacterium]
MATVEELQAERDTIIANSQERADLVDAGTDRSTHLNDPTAEFGRAFTTGISEIVGVPVDVVNAMLNAGGIGSDRPIGSGDNIQDVLDELMGYPEGMGTEPEGAVQGAGKMLGVTAVMTPAMLAPFMEAAMLPQLDFEQKQFRDIGKFQGSGMEETVMPADPERGIKAKTIKTPTPGHIPRSRAARVAFLLKQIGERGAKFAVDRPAAFIAGETAMALGAGAAGEMAEEAGAGPGTRMGVEVGAGIVSGLVPAAMPRMMRNMYRWGMRNIVPFTEAGAELRAAQQMQIRAEDPEAAAESVLALAARQEAGEDLGVTPARATGEERLMAQERRVFEDDPVLDKQVREDLESAIKRTQGELSGLFGTPRGKEAWEQAIFQRVAPEGVEISPGTSEEMLDQLYQSFRPLYDEIKGYPIRPNLYGKRQTSLETMIKNAPESNRIQADQAKRDAVARRLKAMWSGFSRNLKTVDGVIQAPSEKYLKLRQDMRAEARKRTKVGDHESAALYRIAEEKIDDVLRDQLEPDLLTRLKTVDSHYRNYKITEDAVYRRSGTDQGLTPEGLLASLRASASSKGGYARGEAGELRSLAVSGKPIAKMIEDPAKIRRAVSSMSEDDLANTKADFFETMMRKAMVSQDETEGVSGTKLKRMLDHYSESAAAVRMTEEDLMNANTIADSLIVAERSSPAAVSQLYEDGPSNILQLFATLVGAKHGQKIAGRGMGSSLVLAQYFANKARGILGHFTTEQATALLTRAQTDPELYAHLLTRPDARPAVQIESAQYLNAYLAELARRTGEGTTEHWRETYEQQEAGRARRSELDRLSREAEMIVPF